MPSLRIDDEIVLKILEPEDAEKLFALTDSNRTYLRRWLPWVDSNTTLDHSKHFIISTQEQLRLNYGFQCGIWFRGNLAGIIGYHSIDWMNKIVEIGYWIGEHYQGHGMVTKSCRALVDYAYYEYQLNRVQIRCATGNDKSNAIIERLGFVKEGLIQQGELLYDHFVDLYIYGMTSEAWKARYGEQSKKMFA
ncbi:MAG: N-acetyltransferase [Ignavibacteriae bacterium]|nr:MAG: N-acetyltransferase [Ignavibacteriota bacterium]